jgi:two-component system, sensor histidine kinase PdtaS
MYRAFLVQILILLTSTVPAQDAVLVRGIISRIKNYNTQQQLEAYDSLLNQYRDAQPAEGLQYGRSGLQLSIAVKDSGYQGYFLSVMGVMHKNLANIDSAVYYYHQSIDLETAHHFPEGVAGNYNNIATVYRLAGKYVLSLEYYRKALAIMRDSFHIEEHAHTIYQNIAELMIENNKKEQAWQILQEAEAYFKRQPVKTGLAHVYLSKAQLLKNDSLQSAIFYCREAGGLYKKVNRMKEFCQSLNLLAQLYVDENSPGPAMLKVEESIGISNENGFSKECADGLAVKATLLLNRKDWVAARGCLLTAVGIYERQQISKSLPRCYQQLAEAEEKLGHLQSANTYLRLYQKVNDSLNNVQLKTEFNQLQLKYNLSENERVIENLKDSAAMSQLVYERQRLNMRQQRSQNFFLSVLSLVVIGFTVLFRYRYLQKKKLSRQLQTALTEKDILLREVHHRVKNNLQIIGSLLNLQRETGGHQTADEAIRLTQDRIYTMSVIHEQLYKSEHFKNIPVAEYIGSLCGYYRQAYNLAGKKIVLTSNVRYTHPIVFDQLITLGLILNELIINSIKYAFGASPGTIVVEAGGEPESFTFSVADNGRGLPAGQPELPNNTLGMQLVKGLAAQLKASVEISNQPGLAFTFVFKPIVYEPG